MAIRGFVCALACAIAAFAASASAQPTFPDRPIHLVVGFPPGGATDVIARVVAKGLSEQLGQSVVVDNKGGASGMIGSESVVRAPPDGYTLLFAPSSHATLKELYPTSMHFDPEKDFTPVATVASTPYLFVVNPKVPAKTMQEFLDYARAHPGKMAYASTGMGTAQHLAGEVLRRTAKVDILHVPYKGSGAVRTDLLAGTVPTMFDNVAVLLPYVQRGDLRALAVTSPERSALVPDVPTLRELGLGEAEIEGWFIVLGPVGLPAPVVERLNTAINKVLASPATANTLKELGAKPLIGPPQNVTKLVAGDREHWGKVIREAGIKPE
jgi:tripartite-type tricarboxylate transporter receptor subunit TctC